MTETRKGKKPAKPDRGGVVASRRRLQAAKLAAVTAVVQALAHESRNALQRGQACLSLLRLKVKEQPELLALVDETELAQERLVQLYDQVREFARAPALQYQSIAIDALLRDEWKRVPRREDHQLDLAVTNQDVHCQADPNVLGAALNVLLVNAVEATPPGSTVSVEIADAQIEDVPALSVTVRDDGPGLPGEPYERLFELFYSTKSGHNGLGLAQAREQVEAHGGNLCVLDADRAGARFQLIVPR